MSIRHIDFRFAELRAANLTRQKEWDGDNAFSALYFSNALAGEVGEAANVVKKLERQSLGLRGSVASVSDLADELADVIIYADLLAARVGIDLGKAVITKFNATSNKYNLKTKIDI